LPGEIVLGSELAASLGVAVGERLFSDQDELYDLSVPQALALEVVGVLAPSGGPDDHVAFGEVVTTWAVAGLAHGHQDAEAIEDEELVLADLEDRRILGPALSTSNDPLADGLGDFHLHGDRSSLPLTAVLFFPADRKAATLVRARIDERDGRQMVAPRAVVDGLLALVFRVRDLLDLFAALLAASTLVLGALVVGLSVRLRSAELRTLDRLGASRSVAVQTVALEVLFELLAAALLASGALAALLAVVPDPDRWF
ncbi:MAG: hypothetical protein AAFZ65_15960, partial [Planctomycetota bacterium]